jgi:(p)ppGpp synthase/HD superfamily hydrolase
MTIPKLAEDIAYAAHAGQKRWNGDPYITHPRAVAALVRAPRQKVVAWLHDVLEDCPDWTPDKLERCGIPEDLVIVVEILTRKEYESYYDYIMRITNDDMAIIVKLADLEHNLSDLEPGPRKDKYLLSREVLRQIENI